MSIPIADCSSWQGAINYPLLKSKTAGVILRAGNGLYTDAKFAGNCTGLAGHPLGAYWFVRSDVPGSTQAAKFLDALGSRVFSLGLVMDAETNYGNLSKTALRSLYGAFLAALHAGRPNDKLVVYTRATYWDPAVGVAGWEAQYALWVAHYGVENPAIPLAWADKGYWLHQFSADGNGLGAEYGVESDDIDLNKLAVPVPDPTPVPPPGDKIGTIKQPVNFRAYPVVVDCTKQRVMAAGEKVTIIGERDGFCEQDWWKVKDKDGISGWVAKPFVEVE